MMVAVTKPNYFQNHWNAVKTEVVTHSILWTTYDVALKALAYCALWIPFIGTPLALSLFAFSVVIDVAVVKQWPAYLAGIRAFFDSKVPAAQHAARSAADTAKGSVFDWMLGRGPAAH